jgi:hypothetical protein
VIETEILSRAYPTDPWHHVMDAGFYRLQGAAGELHNGPIPIWVTHDRLWLVRVPHPDNALGEGTLNLEVEWRAP